MTQLYMQPSVGVVHSLPATSPSPTTRPYHQHLRIPHSKMTIMRYHGNGLRTEQWTCLPTTISSPIKCRSPLLDLHSLLRSRYEDEPCSYAWKSSQHENAHQHHRDTRTAVTCSLEVTTNHITTRTWLLSLQSSTFHIWLDMDPDYNDAHEQRPVMLQGPPIPRQRKAL